MEFWNTLSGTKTEVANGPNEFLQAAKMQHSTEHMSYPMESRTELTSTDGILLSILSSDNSLSSSYADADVCMQKWLGTRHMHTTIMNQLI